MTTPCTVAGACAPGKRAPAACNAKSMSPNCLMSSASLSLPMSNRLFCWITTPFSKPASWLIRVIACAQRSGYLPANSRIAFTSGAALMKSASSS